MFRLARVSILTVVFALWSLSGSAQAQNAELEQEITARLDRLMDSGSLWIHAKWSDCTRNWLVGKML